jgi:thiopeptide-type bacteriocin biosynthesis protein
MITTRNVDGRKEGMMHDRQAEEQQLQLDWLYVRIYCQPEQADDLLLSLIACMHELQAQQLIGCFFFVRYLEGGFHLRLRCSGKRNDLLGPVRARLNTLIATYFEQQGAYVHAPLNWGPEGIHDQNWQRSGGEIRRPVPSFEYDRYEPEDARYGGSIGMQMSEEHFMRESELVLDLLQHEGRSRKNVRRNIALLLLQELALAFGLGARDMAHLFGQQAHYWINSSWLSPRQRDSLEPAYQALRPALHKLLASHASHGEQKKSFWSDLMHRWHSSSEHLYRTLTDERARAHLTEEPRVLLSSYIHMFCNRLGFFPPDEAFLLYLLSRYYEDASDAFAWRDEQPAEKGA